MAPSYGVGHAVLVLLGERANSAKRVLPTVERARHLLIIAMLLNDPDAVDRRIAQMDIRHHQRRKDIERYYRDNDPDGANDTG